MEILVSIATILVVFILPSIAICCLNDAMRKKECEKLLAILQNMVNKSQYNEALNLINKKSILVWRYKLPPEIRMVVNEIEADCLEHTGQIKEAVLSLSSSLASTYEYKKWPQNIYDKWIRLYNSIEPLPIEKFYFCSCCGIHPDEARLLDSAISLGCKPPIGYPGKPGPAILIEFTPPKKAKASLT